MLSEKIHIERPYLILNITSGECITCRTAAVNILNKITKTIAKSKIILLSDDKNMNIYFKENEEIFGGYQTVFDKRLSRLLSNGGPSATACLIGIDSMHCFTLTKANNDSIAYIRTVLSGKTTGGKKRIIIQDSITRSASRLYFDKEICTFLNTQFQVGLLYNIGSGVTTYIHEKCSDETMGGLLGILGQNGYNGLSTAAMSDALLKKKGVSPAIINAINLHDRRMCFKAYATSISVSENLQDTTIKVLANMFLAKDLMQGSDPLNVDNYKSFSLLGSVVDNNDTLTPLIGDYEFANDHYYMPYWNSKGSIYKIQNGRKINKATDVRIVEMDFDNNKHARRVHVYSIQEGKDGPGNYYFRVTDAGLPVVVSKTNKTINFLSENKRTSFSEFIYEAGDTVTNIFDITCNDNLLKFVAVTGKNNFVKGTYNILTAKIEMYKLDNKDIVYDKMRIDGDNILAFRKNENENELILDQFAF